MTVIYVISVIGKNYQNDVFLVEKMTYKNEELITYCNNCAEPFSLLDKHTLSSKYCDRACKQAHFRKREEAKGRRRKCIKPVTESECDTINNI